MYLKYALMCAGIVGSLLHRLRAATSSAAATPAQSGVSTPLADAALAAQCANIGAAGASSGTGPTQPATATAGEGASSSVLHRAVYRCDRASAAKDSVRAPDKNARRSKKDADCQFLMELTVTRDRPNEVVIRELRGPHAWLG